MIRWILFSTNLRWKKYQANFLHAQTGRKYYVIKIYGKLIVTSKYGIRRLKDKKILKRDFDYAKLAEISVYQTPSSTCYKK